MVDIADSQTNAPLLKDNSSLNDDLPPTIKNPTSEDISRLLNSFREKFDGNPDFVTRAPGRVNLIGDHIDYCGFSVFPMAIQQHILIAVRKEKDSTLLRLSNVNPIQFEDYQCDLSNLSISTSDGAIKWYHYFLCGLKGILDELQADTSVCGMSAMVLGTIPQCAGLSSSSALVCAASLAAATLFKAGFSKRQLADISAKSERFIGTMGGGMDQAVSFLATEGYAQHISFHPLLANDVKLPDNAVFVIANSLVEKDKANSSDYNKRVVEIRFACLLLCKMLKIEWKGQPYWQLWSKIQARSVSPNHLKALITEYFHDVVSRETIKWDLSMNNAELTENYLSENTKDMTQFKCKQRALHVIRERERVSEFIRYCKDLELGRLSQEECLAKLGELMLASHESLRVLYECSHPELDKIVELSKGLAFGARLTGAGWGGCSVILTDDSKVDDYIDMLKDKFYKNNPNADDKDLAEVIFSVKPGSGAAVYIFN